MYSSKMLKCTNIPNIIVCTPLPFCWGWGVGSGWNFYQIFKKGEGGLDKTLVFRRGLLGKGGFLIFWHAKILASFSMPLGWHIISTNASFNSFSIALRFSNLICQAKKLSWLEQKLKQYAWQKSFFK